MAKDDPHFRLRIPAETKAQIEKSAAESGRSINAEIVVRLQQSLNGAFLDLSAEGFVALIKRLEATIAASEDLFMMQRDALKELQRRLDQDNH
jgi:hypothetical protein